MTQEYLKGFGDFSYESDGEFEAEEIQEPIDENGALAIFSQTVAEVSIFPSSLPQACFNSLLRGT